MPGVELMANAGTALARQIEVRYGTQGAVVIVCGKGNNGGDGFVIARQLGRRARVLLLASRDAIVGDARFHLDTLAEEGGVVVEVPDEAAWARESHRLQGAAVVVDAVLGTGLRRAPVGLPAAAIRAISTCGAIVVAVDIPSGVPSDGETPEWGTVKADLTVSFASPKRGHVLPPSCDRCGVLEVVDIGIPESFTERAGLGLVEAADVLAVFPSRDPEGHKGRFGHVLVIAGSVGKTGAAILAGTAALRSGAGLVTVATPEAALPLVAAGCPELMTEPLQCDGHGDLGDAAVARCLELAGTRDAIVLGPGLGTRGSTPRFARAIAAECSRPLLVDADGLNALAGRRGIAAVVGREAKTVLTPHPGEAGRLLGVRTSGIQEKRLDSALELARTYNATVVLKGYRSVIARPDGFAAVNPTGNPGMASAGTGDVLSGVVGALLARVDPWSASVAGTYLHGCAGDLGAAEWGQEGLMASDVCRAIPAALRELRRGSA